MTQQGSTPVNANATSRNSDEYSVLRRIVEGTAPETGQLFFAALVRSLASAMNTHGAWVTEYLPEQRTLRALSFWMGNGFIPEFDMFIDGTPCERVVDDLTLVHYPDNLIALYPRDNQLQEIGAVSYMGVPLLGANMEVMGHLAVLDTKPMPADSRLDAVLRIFAARAAAELQRLRAESAVRDREARLSRIVHAAMDAIIELDAQNRIVLVNPAGEFVFGASAQELSGKSFDGLLEPAEATRLREITERLDSRPEGKQHVWIAGGLRARRVNGETFTAEATVSRLGSGPHSHHMLILRNVNDRLEAERKIQSLTVETEYLREEIRELRNHGDILAQSPAMQRVLNDVHEVGATDATVLILGETGTGKDLIARAIHSASTRRNGPMVRVNCAAVPAMLMESEFFGHEKGAFTGATAKREGRFALAHGGTIFLDEVGELPLDLQAKLLRVLQDGEFEPVGSSRTQKVDVRVIAATNRDLEEAAQEGSFREDLYYRLNVFPIEVPPLRARGDDIVLLATAFAERFARRMGKTIAPLTPQCAARLKAYAWPGNVRELQNIIERAVITAREGRLNLDRCLPDSTLLPEPITVSQITGDTPILNAEDLRALERANIERALEASGGKISGADGAAKRLGMNASTLTSRMKVLGIDRKR